MTHELTLKAALHSPDLEASVLGMALMHPRTLEIVLPILKVDDFHSPINQVIYNTIMQLFTENILCDEIVLVERLLTIPHRGYGSFKNELEYVGGPSFIVGLSKRITSAVNIREHALLIKQYSIKRKLGRIAATTYELSMDPTVDSLDLLSKTETQLSELRTEVQVQSTTSLQSTILATLAKMHEASAMEGDAIGISCGLKSVDKQTLGFNAPDLIILAGNPGEGKSTLALQWAIDMAKQNIPVGFVSLEMKGFQLVLKMLSMETGISVQELRRGLLSQVQWASVNKAASFLSNLNFHYADKGGLSIIEFKAMVTGWVKTLGVRLIALDYLQLLTVFGSGKNLTTREQEVNYISKQLKALCMDLDVPIIALSQMSRREKGAPRKPVMSDLRESGALEQDADGIMFVHRPVYNGIFKSGTGVSYSETDAFLLIEKYRLGRVGGIALNFIGGESRFTEKNQQLSFTNSSKTSEEFDEGFNED